MVAPIEYEATASTTKSLVGEDPVNPTLSFANTLLLMSFDTNP
jgi:hypothetical protein